MSGKASKDTDVYYTLLPTRTGERTYALPDLLAVQICYGIAAWFFLAGAQTGLLLPAKEAIPTILAGQCIPLLFIIGSGIVSTRIGVEQMTSSIGIFGQKGTNVVMVFYTFCLYPSQAMLCLLFGQSATKFLKSLAGESIMTGGFGVTFFGICCLVIGGFITWLGPNALKWFTRISAVSMFLILFGLIIYVIGTYGMHEIFAAKPHEPALDPVTGAESLKWSRATALETNVGMGLSWAFFIGQWSRLAKSETAAYHGCMWGWGFLACIAGIFAAFTALATGIYDPTVWIIQMAETAAGKWLALLGLILMAVANVSSFATATYPYTISLRSRFPKIKWVLALAIAIVPILVLLNESVYNAISNVYAFIAALSSIYGAIVVFDLLFVCKGKWSLRELFNHSKGYSYYKGYNPGALIVLAAGCIFYLLLLNPLTYTSPTGLFPYIGAGVPTFFFSGILYVILMKCWILKKYPVTFVNDIKYPDQIEEEKASKAGVAVKAGAAAE